MKSLTLASRALILCAISVVPWSIACSSGDLEEVEDIGTVSEAFNPSSYPGALKGHVMITRKAIDVLAQRGLLPALLDPTATAEAENNVYRIIYGNNFADHPEAGWPNVANPGNEYQVVPNRMTDRIPSTGTLPLQSTNARVEANQDYVELTDVQADVSASLYWTKNVGNPSMPPSAVLKWELQGKVTAELATIDVWSVSSDPLVFAADNLYHYSLGDLRDLNDPSVISGDMRLRPNPFLPSVGNHTIDLAASLLISDQSLLEGADYGVAKYGAILYQLARRFFLSSSQPLPNLADLIKVGNDVPGWRTGYMKGHGLLSTLSLDFPHTYLGGMPYVCKAPSSAGNQADPCATGTPTWPPWILSGNSPDPDLNKLDQASPGRSNHAAFIYLGWATHMMQDASLPHHAASWSGPEHGLQDAYGDNPWYYNDYSSYAGQTITVMRCTKPCLTCPPICRPIVIPHPYAAYAPYSAWHIDPYMETEVNSLFGWPNGPHKTRAEICQSLAVTDESPSTVGLNWETVYPLFLANMRRAYYQRQPALRGDEALAAGREYVKNAVIGTAKLILCAIPNGPSIPAAPAGAPRAVLLDRNGRGQKVEPGIYDAKWSGPHSLRTVGDNKIAALTLPPGYQAQLFDASLGMGANQLFTQSGPTSSFNEIASSVFVTKNGESGSFFIKLKRDWSDTTVERDFGMERFLTILGTSSNQGIRATSSPFGGSIGQQWRFNPNSRQLVNAGGLCLEVMNGFFANGTELWVMPCHGGGSQQWQISSTGQIINANGKCVSTVTTAGAVDMSEHRITTMWSCTVPEAQSFDFVYGCSHDPCTTGRALLSSCSVEVGAVCAADSYCCNTFWDSNCIDSLPTKCQWHTDRPRGTPVRRSTECGTLLVGQGLVPGQVLSSCDGRFELRLQTDGDLVLRQIITFNPPPPPPAPGGTTVVLWETGMTAPAGMLIMQGDGHLVQYDSNGVFQWGSWTNGHSGTFVKLWNNGELAIYDGSSNLLWSSGTCCH